MGIMAVPAMNHVIAKLAPLMNDMVGARVSICLVLNHFILGSTVVSKPIGSSRRFKDRSKPAHVTSENE